MNEALNANRRGPVLARRSIPMAAPLPGPAPLSRPLSSPISRPISRPPSKPRPALTLTLTPTLMVMLLAILGALVLTATQAGAAEAPPAPLPRAGLVVQDTALRGAPREAAPVQTPLARGEAVELRAERGEHWQVWDYRRERGGWLRKSQVMLLPRGDGAAAELLAQLRLARQQWGTEGLAIGLAAAWVQAASPADLAGAGGAEALDAMGQAADRIAERASVPPAAANRPAVAAAPPDTLLAAQLDVAARYGLRFVQVEGEDGRVQVCYDGELFRRVLALPAASPEQRLRAALSLTRPECAPLRASPRERQARDAWRAEVLAAVDPGALPPHLKNRWLMRRASVAASLAYLQAAALQQARPDAASLQAGGGASEHAAAALADFTRVAVSELAEVDIANYNDTAMRVNAARWLARPASAAAALAWGSLSLGARPGVDGQTCLQLRDERAGLLAQRCSFGVVVLASASLNREATALALAVQPLDGWRELWVFVKSREGWRVEVLPPAAAAPGLGVSEFAGWVPGGQQMLVARESRAEGRYRRAFELVSLATLQPERQAGEARALGAFQRWADAGWVGGSPGAR
jgi:hypothetical protein